MEHKSNDGYMYVIYENQAGSLRFDYNDDLITDLVENSGWLEFTNGRKHIIQPEIATGLIREINWNE